MNKPKSELDVTREVSEILEVVYDQCYGSPSSLLKDLIDKLKSGEYIVTNTKELEWEKL